jgi:hypothetical protein
MAIVDDDLAISVSSITTVLLAPLKWATDNRVDILDHHLSRYLVLVNYHLELLLILVELLIRRNLLGYHLNLVNLRQHEPVLLLCLLLLLLLVLHDLEQLLLGQLLWLILDLVLLRNILLLNRCASWLLDDDVLLLFRLLLSDAHIIFTRHLDLLVLTEVVNLYTIPSLIDSTTSWLDYFTSVLSIFY